jgi:gamma-glutamyl hercynylcysteine S-oxide synthase
MKSIRKKIQTVLLILYLASSSIFAQKLDGFEITGSSGLLIGKLTLSDSSSVTPLRNKPLFSFNLDNKIFYSSLASFTLSDGRYAQVFGDNVRVFSTVVRDASPYIELVFENAGRDTVSVSNVVPFGHDSSSVHISGKGPWDLARAWLFRPGYRPVRVILPDNAWEMGYTSFQASGGLSVCAIARRLKTVGGQRQRYETKLPPGAKVVYAMHAETYRGAWQDGLRLMFRDRYLHDLDKFDHSLYQREDLQWIKKCYLIVLQMAWDREFYDRQTGKYNFGEVLRSGIAQFGKLDVYGIWPTWPRLGLDQRNQWDLYRDLPGGTKQIKAFARVARQAGTRFFIAYNPWDQSTRLENHLKGMAAMISETDADGVVLDTRGSSSYELQSAADSVRKGVVMYSEGMAVTKDMPGIISGRVHNAIYLSPELNLNKLIKPDFSIFRVCDVGEDLIHRELAIAFFNGYGTELNMFRPGGRDDDYRNDMDYLAKTTFILRQNNDAFLDYNWTPLIDTKVDDVYVSKWTAGEKTVYTVLNMRPSGINGNIISVTPSPGKHWVSLWNHENIKPVTEKNKVWIPAKADGWQESYRGTRREGSVDCIAELPVIIKSELTGDSLKINNPGRGSLLVWKGNPSYKNQPKELRLKNDTVMAVRDLFGFYEGKIVIQLLEDGILLDENVHEKSGGIPWLVSRKRITEPARELPSDMVLVPGTKFSYTVTTGEDFLPYPDVSKKTVKIDTFLIDRYPVTNLLYWEFLMNSGYRPQDTTRFLRHWAGGKFRQGQEKFPVVNLSYEDMEAYARWAGKRLPTEAEWQLAAQGTDGRKWPWGNEFHGALCNNSFARSTPVDAFPKGQSMYGAVDMVGNVWQMTADMYFNGSYYLSVIRGGSHYKPESSWWYVQGGPQPLDKTQIMLLVSPGFDRSSTVGFRCVKDYSFFAPSPTSGR